MAGFIAAAARPDARVGLPMIIAAGNLAGQVGANAFGGDPPPPEFLVKCGNAFRHICRFRWLRGH